MVAVLPISLRLACTSVAVAVTVALNGCASVTGWLPGATTPTAAPTSANVDPLNGWVRTTDPISGASVMLPAEPTVDNSPYKANDGTMIPMRHYEVALADGRGVSVFQVSDPVEQIIDLDSHFQALVNSMGPGSIVTSKRHFDLDGHPALDARFTYLEQGDPYVNLCRIVSDRGYLVLVGTIGPITQENALNGTHQQIANTLRLL